MKKSLRMDDLVVLGFAPNNCYPKVIIAEEALSKYGGSLEIDLQNKTWVYKFARGAFDTLPKPLPIGESRFIRRDGGNSGPIGVYNRMKPNILI